MRRTAVLALWICGCTTSTPVVTADSADDEAANALARQLANTPAADVAAVAVGESHSCALFADGRVACWGGAWDGDTYALVHEVTRRVNACKPAWVEGVREATAIDAFGRRTCAVMRDGTVSCWDERVTPPARTAATPIAGLADVSQVAVGAEHACALRNDKSVWCWGKNDHGQIGGSGDRSDAPRRVEGLAAAVEISLAATHSCARSEDGRIACWGEHAGGIAGAAVASRTPVAVPIGSAVSIAAGSWQSCAALATGKVMCWGSQYIGDPHGEYSRPLAPTETYGADTAVAVEVAGFNGCARLASGRLHCWSMGEGASENIGYTTQITELMVRDIAAGPGHVCALLSSGHVACWGEGASGQLGDGGLHDGTRPVAVRTIADARAVAAGRRFSCALHASGEVSCWGWNTAAELGDGGRVDRLLPGRVPGVSGALAIASGTAASCAIVSGGGVRCWGDNQLGTLGDGSEQQHQNAVAVANIGDAIAVDVTLGHLAIARRSGEIVSWGRHRDGVVANKAAARVAGVTQLSTNDWGYGCAIDGARKVWCWGTAIADRSATRRWELAETLSDAVDLSSWGSVACVVTSAATVSCWSDGNDNWAKVSTAPTMRNDVRDAVEVAVGGGHACARLKSGAIVCWGDNHGGQLGRGGYEPSDAAAPVAEIGDALQIDAGEEHTCALRSGGAVSCWGLNGVGELGDGLRGGPPTFSSRDPLIVPGLASIRP